jgi:hypothetical protein
MTTAIPTPLRAVAGLAAATIDEARRLPSRLVGLPVMAVSTALQTSLKVQQHYADLVVRGDELLAQLRPEPTEAPSWARFDDDEYTEYNESYDAEPADDPITEPPPVADYPDLSVPQLRARLRQLSEQEVAGLLDYERATLARPPYLTMLSNRLETLRGN